MKTPTIAVAHGDTNGISYELILRAFTEPTLLELLTPIVYGSPKVAAYHRKAIDIGANFTIISTAEEARHNRFNLLTTFEEEVKVELGVKSQEAGRAAFRALERAAADLGEQKVDALVVAPTDNSTMQSENYRFNSIKSYLEATCDSKDKGLLLTVSDRQRMAFFTDHQPLRDVAAALTEERLLYKLRLLHATLARDFGIDKPRVAVLALNDSDANGCFYGDEEADVIAPVVKQLNEEGLPTWGPLPPAEYYDTVAEGTYDAVMFMYEGQCTAGSNLPVGTVSYQYIAGLPSVVTLVNHSVGYRQVGREEADPAWLLQAVYGAIDISRQRASWDEAHANPLPKLSHERRDDGEKARFAQS